MPPSTMSLLGLVRHMAEVERHWFGRVLLGGDTPPQFWSKANPDADFDDVEAADPTTDMQGYLDACASARNAVDTVKSLDAVAAGAYPDRPVTLRWILIHMIEEYARHNGHADLLRQRIDGATGD